MATETATAAMTFKAAAHQLVDTLPDDAVWEDLLYAIGVRERLERALAESAAGKGTPHEEVLRRFGVSQ